MMAKTSIEWATDSWNPVTGCTKISPGCAHCYAERMAKRLRGRCGYPEDEPFRVTLHPERIEDPLRWRKPRRVFVCSMSDLFHEDVPELFINRVFGIMDLKRKEWDGTVFMILTKRPERMQQWVSKWYDQKKAEYRLSNVWLGVSAENQEMANKRIPILLETPAAVRFVSVEPMLGYIRLFETFSGPDSLKFIKKIDWIICGGESGPGARPMDPSWVRSLRNQCLGANIPFFFKQWGEWIEVRETTQEIVERYSKEVYTEKNGNLFFRVGKKAAGRSLDGQEWNQYPNKDD